jgi:hypothetical protein
VDSRLAADLRAVAVICGDLRRKLAREHGRDTTRTARVALELAEAALRYAGHEADPATCGLYGASTPMLAREKIIMLVAVLIGAAEEPK